MKHFIAHRQNIINTVKRVGGEIFFKRVLGGYLMNMPLTSSILSGIGSLVSHTRGGSGATVTDFEGIVKTAIADEIRFVGARRVENIAIKSEGWVVGDDGGSTDPWLYTAANATSTINADGTITFTAAAADFNSAAFAQLNAATTTLGYKAGQEYIGQIRIRTSGTPGDMRLRLRSSGPYQAGPTTVVTVTNAWQTLVSDILTKNADSNLVALELVGQAAGGLTEVDVEFGMIERVDGQTIQVPSEYVSIGVGETHGSNVDGVQYLSTQNGNSVASGVLSEATGAAIPDADLQGVLIEGASTNLCTESWDLTQAVWTKTNSQIDSTDVKKWLPHDVYRLEASNTNNSQHRIISSFTPVATGVVTFSFYCQAGEVAFLALFENGDGTGDRRSRFNLSTETWTSVDANHTVSTEIVSTGVYRLSVTSTWTTGAGRPVGVNLCNSSGSIVYPGVVGEGAWLSGIQIEELEDSTTYIPTNGATVTRLDEELTLSLTDTLGETGTAAATITPNFTGATTANKQIISDPSASGEQILGIAKLLAASTTFEVDRGNAATQNTDTTNGVGTITAWTRYKAALTWDKAANTMLCVADGGTVQTTTTANAMTDVTQLQIGNISTGAMPANSPIRDVIITKKLSTNAELVGLTT